MGETAGAIKGSRTHHLPSHCDDQPSASHVNPWLSTAPTTSRTVNRATDGEFCATVTTGPDLDTIFSILPFSGEQLTSAQGEDHTLQRLSISPSTPPTDGIEVRDHQGVLYRRIQKGDNNCKIQLIVPKILIQQTIKHFHRKTPERHLGRLKTPLRILEVAWWPTIRSDTWRFVGNCKSCGVETKECAVINPSCKPPHNQHHHHSSASTSSSTKETHKTDRRKCWGEWRARKAGCFRTLGGMASPTQGHPGWHLIPPLSSVPVDSSGRLVPLWEGLVLPNLLQRHF
ncbi:uncharacterized protein LOC125277930 [Megalobrama amblycephala]|uniref:uncharacterized protein LOC125277930 n=1 Tax=Megalobrama amblycephala TaxID=75352 RepID=UPI0020146C80|nr:uncharacterized protein LOC125277930 [Megalobrama amblycephala]